MFAPAADSLRTLDVARFRRQHGIRPYRPTYRQPRGDPMKQSEVTGDLAELGIQAEADELVHLSQGEAQFPMVPTIWGPGSLRLGTPTSRAPSARPSKSPPAYRFAARGAPIPGLIRCGPLADGRTSKSKMAVGM